MTEVQYNLKAGRAIKFFLKNLRFKEYADGFNPLIVRKDRFGAMWILYRAHNTPPFLGATIPIAIRSDKTKKVHCLKDCQQFLVFKEWAEKNSYKFIVARSLKYRDRGMTSIHGDVNPRPRVRFTSLDSIEDVFVMPDIQLRQHEYARAITSRGIAEAQAQVADNQRRQAMAEYRDFFLPQ